MIEQWGEANGSGATYTFTVPFSNTNYSFMYTVMDGHADPYYHSYASKTNNRQVYIYDKNAQYSSNHNVMFYAIGY